MESKSQLYIYEYVLHPYTVSGVGYSPVGSTVLLRQRFLRSCYVEKFAEMNIVGVITNTDLMELDEEV